MSRVTRKAVFCICQNKGAAGDQRLCFRHVVSSIPLLLKSEISSLYPSSVVVQPGLYLASLGTPKTGFLIDPFLIINKFSFAIISSVSISKANKFAMLRSNCTTRRFALESLCVSVYLSVCLSVCLSSVSKNAFNS